MDNKLSRVFASALNQALPYIQQFRGSTIVVKFGGNAMQSAETSARFARDLVLLKAVGVNPVVVHGGGPQISSMLERLALPNKFHNGLRVTDAATMEVVEMVLGGSINKLLVQAINNQGGVALGLSGRDGRLLSARKYQPDGVDLGQVGEIVGVNNSLLAEMSAGNNIPVLAPIATDAGGLAYNVNADQVAAAVAGALGCRKLLYLTNAAGVFDANGELIANLDRQRVADLVAEGIIATGMIPKINSAVQALADGVESVHIIDGRVEHALLLELFSDAGIGTLLR